MVSKRQSKISKALDNLDAALQLYSDRQKGNDLPFLTVCKALEVAFEYIWRELKSRVEVEGLFAVSPKEAIRQAAVLGLIGGVEEWIAIATARNDSVHDYFGIPEPKYVELAGKLLTLARKVKW